MFWHFLKNTLYYCFRIYFRGYKVKNADRIRQEGPMFIAMNHPNAFMDPICFSSLLFYPRTYYMARGDAFKKGLASLVLQSMGIVPIYRLRDGGYESVKKNLESFKLAYNLLDKKSRIMVFAEGLSIKERRLRSIQKGTAKMAFGYLDQGGNAELKILPVGINYSEPEKFRPYVFFNIGEPIAVKDFYDDYKKQPAQTIIKLTALIEEHMKPLVPSLADGENDVVIEQLQPVLKKEFLAAHGLDPANAEHQQKYWEFIIARLNTLTTENPVAMDEFRKEVDAYDKQLHQLKLRDHLIAKAEKGESMLSFANLFLLVFGFPFYVIGKVLNFLPYYLAQRIARKKVKHIEFKASVTFGTGAIMLNLFFLLELLIIWLLWHSWYLLLAYTAAKALCGLAALFYSPFRKKMLGAFRLSRLKKTSAAQFGSLLAQRRKILSFIGDFH